MSQASAALAHTYTTHSFGGFDSVLSTADVKGEFRKQCRCIFEKKEILLYLEATESGPWFKLLKLR